MSWRILFEPAYFNDDPTDTAAADQVIPLDASYADIEAAAKQWAWQRPLKIWTPSTSDLRFEKFVKVLESELVSPDDYTVFVKPPKD